MRHTNIARLFLIVAATAALVVQPFTFGVTIAEQVEITFAHWVSDSSGTEAWDQIVELFEQRYPNIQVNTLYGGSGGFDRDKTKAMFAAGIPPDVFRIDDDEVPFYAAENLVVNLDPMIERDAGYFSRYPENIVRLVGNAEGTFAMAPFLRPLALAANVDVLNARGVALPGTDWETTWTWEEFREAGRSVVQDREGDGVVDVFFRSVPNSTHWLTFVAQNGGAVFRGGEWALDEPESVEAFEFIYELMWEDRAIQTLQDSSRLERGDGFFINQLALKDIASSEIGTYRETAGESISWDLVPHPRNKRPATELYVVTFSIPASSQHLREAWEFMKFLYSREVQEIIAATGSDMPADRDAALNVWVGDSHVPEHMEVLVDALEWGHTMPFIPEMGAIQQKADDLILKIWDGTLSVQRAIEEYSRIARIELSK